MIEPSTPLRNLGVPMRFCIKLRIYPGSLQPNQVSEILGVDATSVVSPEPMHEPVGAFEFRLGKHNGGFWKARSGWEAATHAGIWNGFYNRSPR
jgi:hypothetical protein